MAKIDGLDWLHKVREESKKERKRRGVSGAEWLREIRAQVEAYLREHQRHDSAVARDRKAGE